MIIKLFSDLLNYFLSFISDDDCWIHHSLILINKRFNNIISNNYVEFNYPGGFESLRLPFNEMCLNFRQRLGCRLYDGYWIIDVSIGDDYK